MDNISVLQCGDKIAFKIINTSDREIKYVLSSSISNPIVYIINPKTIIITNWQNTGCCIYEKIDPQVNLDLPHARSGKELAVDSIKQVNEVYKRLNEAEFAKQEESKIHQNKKN